MPLNRLFVLHFGLGAIGQEIARRIQKIPGFESVAAVDPNPSLAGKSLAEILNDPAKKLGKVFVSDRLRKSRAKVAIHSTRSWIREIEPELKELLQAGFHVVSTAEELVFPTGKNLRMIKRLDRLAKRKGVAFIGAGINPGFVLDLLPVALSHASTGIQYVEARRFVDLRTRRRQLQEKVGVGLTPEEFQIRSQNPHFGHQGMKESLFMLAKGVGFILKKTEITLKPIFASERLTTDYFAILPGQVCGIEQRAAGYDREKERICLEVRMFVGDSAQNESEDQIKIQGNPPMDLLMRGGIAGEAGTCATVINAIPRIVKMTPGCHTLLDLPFR